MSRGALRNYVLSALAFVLLLAWLASPPPARACSLPPPENWFVEVITFDSSTLPAGIEVISLATGERFGYATEVVEIHNLTSLPVIILWQAERDNSPIQAATPPLPAGYVEESLISENESRGYKFSDFLTHTRVQDKNISSYDPIDISQMPDPQTGQILLIHGSHQYVVDFSIAYVVNQEFRSYDDLMNLGSCYNLEAYLVFVVCLFSGIGLIVLVVLPMGILFVVRKVKERWD